MCVDFVEIWFRIANGLSSFFFFFQLSVRNTSISSFPGDKLGKYQWICTKLGICIDITKKWFGIAIG